MASSGRTALYRVIGAADLLLYVGISKDLGRRWKDEAKSFPWWNEKRRMTIEWYDSRPEAEAAEAKAIHTERPKYNQRQGTFPVQLCRGRRVEELTPAEREATARIMRLRISKPALVRVAEGQRCASCGAGPGELCRTASGRLAYYHVARLSRVLAPAWGGLDRTAAEPDLIGM